MDKYRKIVFLGGDRRHAVAARRLSGYGKVSCLGIPEEIVKMKDIRCERDLDAAIEGAEAIILPLPASSDGVHLNAPLDNELSLLKLGSILKKAEVTAKIFGGRLPPEFVLSAERQGITVIDYFESESLQIKNAYTTAEAAVSIAMNTLSRNLRGARFAVTGYGRISRHLCRLLLSLGARVTVAARKEEQLAWARCEGCDTINIAEGSSEIMSLAHGYDLIFNTVPHWIFDRDFLLAADKNTPMIELASAPGGIDVCAAKELSVNVIWATSLPGKYAPESAGEHIAESLIEIICKEEGKI